MNKKDYAQAYPRLSRSLEMNPNKAATADEYAFVSAMLGRKSEAIDGWTTAVRLEPHNAAYRRNLDMALGSNAGKTNK